MTVLLANYDEEVAIEELANVGSFNHSYVQARLTAIFVFMDAFTTFTELSLDTTSLQDETLKAKFKSEIKPDICIYPQKLSLDLPNDILRMTEMPELAIEILSPAQATQVLIEKIKAYFALGVRSCWLVNPLVRSVTVFSAPKQFYSVSEGDIVDDVLSVRIAIADVFGI